MDRTPKEKHMSERPQRNLSLELVRATEAAALVAARHRDSGKWDSANSAAANAMRLVLQTIDMDGVIVVGEARNTPRRFSFTARWSARDILLRWMWRLIRS